MSQRDATVLEVRNRIESIEDDAYRHAFMYQFLIAGEISETCGIYAPSSNDVHKTMFEINGNRIPAVLFIVKSARRKGNRRVCALPLDEQYEPWTRLLLNWFDEHEGEPPFFFGKKEVKIKSNVRYAQHKAKEVFKGLNWEKEAYYNTKTGKKLRDDSFHLQLAPLNHCDFGI